MECGVRIGRTVANRRYGARSAVPAKRQVSLDRPGEMPDLALPGFLPGKICFYMRGNGRQLATGTWFHGGPGARHRSEAAADTTRRGARGGLLHRGRGLRPV